MDLFRSTRLVAVSALGVATALTLSACSGSTEAADDTASGGTLRAAFAGSTTETLNYLHGPTALDYVRARLVHAPLCEIDPSAEDGVNYGVVESIDIADDLSEYTLKVREGVEFTDGSTVTSEDVLYSLRAPVVLEGLPFTLLPSRTFDLDAASAPDESTVVLPTVSPIADGREILCQSMLTIPEGTSDFTEDTPSSGPFTIASFEPGQSTVLHRNPDYYGAAPSLDEIDLLSIADGEARVNALRGGQVDFASGLTPAQAQSLQDADGIAVTTSELPYASYLQFTMDQAQEPFDDPRVREAIKLAVDRDQIVENVYHGLAFVGNDVPGLGFPNYDEDLPQREHDPAAAQELLAEAGAEGFSVTLTAGPELPGMVETATLIVDDLRAIGIDASLNELPAGQLFADYPAYLEMPFRAGYNPPAMFEPNYQPGARADIDTLVLEARSASDETRRLEASHEAQRKLWEEGDQLGPVFVPNISAARDGVGGVRELQFPDLAQATVTP
jgi:peptide/nickel transport system substrate-binding protein